MNASGVATCSLAPSKTEKKTLSLVTPVSIININVVFTQDASTSCSTITRTDSNLAKRLLTSIVNVTLRDRTNITIAEIN